MGVDTYMLLRDEVARRLPHVTFTWIDEHGVLCSEDAAREPRLADGVVLPVLDRWGAVTGDPEAAAYQLRREVGDSVADVPGDPRGIFLFPASVVAEATTYAEALAWLESHDVGCWIMPMTAEEALRYRPPPRTETRTRHRRRAR